MTKENLETLLFFAGFIFIAIMVYLLGSFLHATFNFIDWGFQGRKDALFINTILSISWSMLYAKKHSK